MDKILADTLNLVFSSNRPMPAHYTSNGDRDQSFCIDFEPLTASDDYEMASESFYTASNYITEKSKLSKDQFAAVTKCGEDIMVGAYIITKLGGKELIEEMQKVIIDDTIKTYNSVVDKLKEILFLDEVTKYFNHCADFGKMKAEYMHNDTIQSLIAYCKENNRICPQPQKWNELWEMLPARERKGAGWEPAPPLILAAWHDTPAMLKMLRLQEHISWAEEHGVLQEISIFIRGLSESNWFHIGD